MQALPSKILAIHSFAVHGTASLKACISLLGSRVLPVPSLYLSGLTNMPGHKKIQLDFETLLMSSLQLAARQEEQVICYIGYLGDASQVAIIERALAEFGGQIQAVLVDPVSGDHGRTYVPEAVWRAWPRLLARADWALPNYTELRLQSGLPWEDPTLSAEVYLEAFVARFPRLNFITTSLPHPSQMCLHLQGPSLSPQRFLHLKVPTQMSGTGDVFAAHFLRAHFWEQQAPRAAMQQAARLTLACLKDALQAGSSELLLT